MRLSRVSLALLATAASPLLAQSRAQPRTASPTAVAVRRAVGTITEDGYRQRIMALADDSMRGRGTPSSELETAARYVAAEFRRAGLVPGGDSGTFFQRYRIVRQQWDSTSFVMAMGRGAHNHWMLGRDAAPLSGTPAAGPFTAPVVLVVGAPADTARPFGDVPVAGAIVLQLATYAQLSRADPDDLVRRAAAAGARGWIFLTDVRRSSFAAAAGARMQPEIFAPALRGASGSGIPVFEVRDSSALDVLRAAGEDLTALRAPSAAVVRALPGFTATINVRRTMLLDTSAPNVIGILEGSDPQLRNEYIFFTAHMDHLGTTATSPPPARYSCSAQGADSICNGADDDASGTTGVVALAQAFAALEPRPRRSLVFMTVSGEERGLWGSTYYALHPTLPLASTVADLNIDMIGRNWRDTIVVIGKEHSTLGATANRVTREHPELGMQLIDDPWPRERFYERSDHFNFARRGVPILFFFNGVHADYHRVSDSPDKIDAEKAARIVRMIFYIGLDVANATERPQWNPESRRQIVETGSP